MAEAIAALLLLTRVAERPGEVSELQPSAKLQFRLATDVSQVLANLPRRWLHRVIDALARCSYATMRSARR